MIVVVMREKHGIDARQVFEADTGCSHADWTEPLHRRRAQTPNGVGQQIDARQLNQKCRVADPGDGYGVWLQWGERGRLAGECGCRGRCGQPLPQALQTPAQERAKALLRTGGPYVTKPATRVVM